MFSSVRSLFHYSGFHRELLLRAKDMQDPVAVDLFEQMYEDAVRVALIEIFRAESISLVVVPRLSLRRILGLNWHPADFWMSRLKRLSSENPALHKFSIYMRVPQSVRRRAKVASDVRRMQVAELSVPQEPAEVSSGLQGSAVYDEKKHHVRSILLVDDVLTSGGTLVAELEMIRKLNFEGLVTDCMLPSPVLPLRLNAHILTLFRTPMARLKKG